MACSLKLGLTRRQHVQVLFQNPPEWIACPANQPANLRATQKDVCGAKPLIRALPGASIMTKTQHLTAPTATLAPPRLTATQNQAPARVVAITEDVCGVHQMLMGNHGVL